MKKFNIWTVALLLIISVSTFANTPPGNIQSTFKKMYPKANDIAWSQDDGYYCANFVMNGLTKNVWFNAQGQWAYASWGVDNVTMGEFPKWQAIIVIKVGQDNVDIKYQLFYTPQGVLLKTRNVSYLHDILGPSTFFLN